MDPWMVIAGFMYETFEGTLFLAVGSGIAVFVTAAFARLVRDRRYWDCTKVYAKTSACLFGADSALLVFAILLARSTTQTPEMLLPFDTAVWSIPLGLTLVMMVLTATVMLLQFRTQTPFEGRSNPGASLATLLTSIGLFTSTLALIFFNLLNSFMLAPSVPDSLAVIAQAGHSDPFTQLGLMDNRSFVPLTIKTLLVGTLAFSAVFSGAAAIRRLRSQGDEAERAWFDFVSSWGFKTAILFGAPVGIIGYWNAAILHTTVPSLALGLMGVTTKGISAALVVGLGPLWAVGISFSMSLGAFAGVYYLSRGGGRIALGSSEQKVLKASLPWLIVLLAVGIYGVLYVGEWYPQQFILAFLVLFSGVSLFEAVRRYSLGKVRLYVPALIFTVSCYGLLVYQAPNTLWYNASAFGGISWPLIGFPLLAVTLYYFGTRWRDLRYWIPVGVAAIALLIITVKMADVELVKGATMVALDPSVKPVVQSWAFLNGYDVNMFYREYPIPSNYELLYILLASYAFFLGIYFWATRTVSPFGREASALEVGVVNR